MNNRRKEKQLYYLKNSDKIKKKHQEYYKKHWLKINKHHKLYQKINKIILKKYSKSYNSKNKHRIKVRHQVFYQKNKSRLNEYARIYNIERRKIDPMFNLRFILRSRLNSALKSNHKSGSAVRDLGCSIEFLKRYLEKKFYGSMSWANWGTYWQLDHIKELHTFDLTKREQFIKACNYKNLQPLTIEDHRKKTAVDIRRV